MVHATGQTAIDYPPFTDALHDSVPKQAMIEAIKAHIEPTTDAFSILQRIINTDFDLMGDKDDIDFSDLSPPLP